MGSATSQRHMTLPVQSSATTAPLREGRMHRMSSTGVLNALE